MNQRLIVIDGKTYNDINDMPPDVRALYEEARRNASRNGAPDPLASLDPFADRNNSGAPDIFDSLANITGGNPTVVNTTKILVNGQAFDSLDQLPPELRAKYEQAMSGMDANRNGIPDFVEGMLNLPAQPTQAEPAQPTFTAGTNAPRRSQPLPASSTIEPESSGNWTLIIAGVILFGLCLLLVAGGVWYFLR
jgi:hypothetical protein